MPLMPPVPVCGSVGTGMCCLLNTPKNADGQLENDQAFCRQLHLEKKEDLFERCKLNPTPRGKPHKRDTKADLIFKRVFCNYL